MLFLASVEIFICEVTSQAARLAGEALDMPRRSVFVMIVLPCKKEAIALANALHLPFSFSRQRKLISNLLTHTQLSFCGAYHIIHKTVNQLLNRQ